MREALAAVFEKLLPRPSLEPTTSGEILYEVRNLQEKERVKHSLRLLSISSHGHPWSQLWVERYCMKLGTRKKKKKKKIVPEASAEVADKLLPRPCLEPITGAEVFYEVRNL